MKVFYRPAWEWRVYFRFLDLPYRRLTKDGGLLLSGSTFIFILSKFLHLFTVPLLAFFPTTAFEGRLCARLSEALDSITLTLDKTVFKPYQTDSLLPFLKRYLHQGVAQPPLVTHLTNTNFFSFTLGKAVDFWQVSVRVRALSVRLCRSFPELFIWKETDDGSEHSWALTLHQARATHLCALSPFLFIVSPWVGHHYPYFYRCEYDIQRHVVSKLQSWDVNLVPTCVFNQYAIKN